MGSYSLVYVMEASSLKEALGLALDVKCSSGMVPARIEGDAMGSLFFNEAAAKLVVEGRNDAVDYAFVHVTWRLFRLWVQAYFHPLCVEHLDSYLVFDEVLADYRRMTGDVGMTGNRLRRKIGEWVAGCDYIEALNPYDLCTVKPDPGRYNGRILRRRRDADGNPSGAPVDFIYLRTDPEVYPRTKAECEAEERELEKRSSRLASTC